MNTSSITIEQNQQDHRRKLSETKKNTPIHIQEAQYFQIKIVPVEQTRLHQKPRHTLSGRFLSIIIL